MQVYLNSWVVFKSAQLTIKQAALYQYSSLTSRQHMLVPI